MYERKLITRGSRTEWEPIDRRELDRVLGWERTAAIARAEIHAGRKVNAGWCWLRLRERTTPAGAGIAVLILAMLAVVPDADAGCGLFGRRRARYPMYGCQAQVMPTPQVIQPVPLPVIPPKPVQPTPQPAAKTGDAVDGDPYGFVVWLNGTRAAYGLPAVAWDVVLVADCHQNNLLQAVHGMGHYFMGNARRQNAAAMPYPSMLNAWLASPGHAAALLDPTISFVAIAGYGSYWTFAGR